MQYQLLAPTADAARSATVNVGALGAALSLFTADGVMEVDMQAFVELSVNGAWRPYTRLGETVVLTRDTPTVFVQGPGKYSIRKAATAEPVGVVGDRGAESVDEMVERGQFFGCSPIIQVPVGSSLEGRILLICGHGVLTHLTLETITEQKMYLEVHAVTSVTTLGFEQRINNYYFGHPNRAKAMIGTNPGEPVLGPLIDKVLCEAQGKDSVSGMIMHNKMVLPEDLMMLFSFVNRSAQSGEASLVMRWFETPTETANVTV
jgi:hypothetical protein